ncbi:MAG: purine-nucleoside phosphorylase, partial [Christensenella sp.]
MKERLSIAKNYIEANTDFRPEVVIVLGSGLGDYANTIDEVIAEFNYADIPGFPVSTAPGHAGKLTFGCKAGKRIALLSGRFHCYEGYTAAETVVPLRTLLMLGAKYVLLTNASGGINTDF